MQTETRKWTIEQPDGGIVYGVTVELYEDDGTYLGKHSRHWHLDVDPPTRETVEATKENARQWALDHASEMRQRAKARRQKKQQKKDRRRRAQGALDVLRVSS